MYDLNPKRSFGVKILRIKAFDSLFTAAIIGLTPATRFLRWLLPGYTSGKKKRPPRGTVAVAVKTTYFALLPDDHARTSAPARHGVELLVESIDKTDHEVTAKIIHALLLKIVVVGGLRHAEIPIQEIVGRQS